MFDDVLEGQGGKSRRKAVVYVTIGAEKTMSPG